jgi:hypothetical protein
MQILSETLHGKFIFETTKIVIYSKAENRRRFGNKNKRAYFVFLSTCTIFAHRIKANDYGRKYTSGR